MSLLPKLHKNGLLLLCLAAILGGTCSPRAEAVTGTVLIADQTTPLPSSTFYIHAEPSDPWCYGGGAGPFTAGGGVATLSAECFYDGSWREVDYQLLFQNVTPGLGCGPLGCAVQYLRKPPSGSVHCGPTTQNHAEYSCTGSFSASVYSGEGNVRGRATFENGAPASSWVIWAVKDPASPGDQAGGATSVDQDGGFDFTANKPPPYPQNNWGLPVAVADTWTTSPPYPGAASVEFQLYAQAQLFPAPTWDPLGPAPRVWVTSGQAVERDIAVPCPTSGCPPPPDDPSERPDEECENPAPAPSSGGRPVSVTTGNVFLDQVDGKVVVLRGALAFKRSYNSFAAVPGRFGAFGPGWNHNWERRITLVSATRLALRRADGVVTYFDKQDDTSPEVFNPSTPWRRDRWVVREADGSFTLHFRAGGNEVYAQEGQLLSVSDSFGATTGSSNATTTLSYDDQGRLLRILGPGVRSLNLEYDAVSRLASLREGWSGNLLAAYTYDGSGRLESVTYPDSDDEGAEADGGFTFSYHPTLGLLTTVTDLTGRISEAHDYYPNGLGRTSELADGIERLTFAYSLGQTTVTDARANVTTYDWSSRGGMKRVTRIAGPCSSCGGGTGEVTQWEYDDHGRVGARIDAENKRTEYEYNADSGRVETEILPLAGHLIGYTYHPDGRLWTRTEPNGKVTTWTYVPAGLESVRETTQPGEPDRVTTYSYTSGRGLLETVTDPRGKVTLFEYDGIGDLLFVTDPLGTTTPEPGDHVTAYEHDLMGRRVAVTDPLGHRTETKYNTLGQVIETRRVHFDETQTRHDLVTTVLYDEAGRRATVRDPLGRETSYAYDTYGRLQFVDQPPPGVGQPRPRTTYGYDAMSNLTTIKDAESNGTSRTTVNTYDSYNRLWTVTWPGPEVRQEVYTYWPTGRLKTVTDRKGVISTYLYDELGRMRRREYSGATGGADTTPTEFTYDERGFLGYRTALCAKVTETRASSAISVEGGDQRPCEEGRASPHGDPSDFGGLGAQGRRA